LRAHCPQDDCSGLLIASSRIGRSGLKFAGMSTSGRALSFFRFGFEMRKKLERERGTLEETRQAFAAHVCDPGRVTPARVRALLQDGQRFPTPSPSTALGPQAQGGRRRSVREAE
jgi:hypothetical protein